MVYINGTGNISPQLTFGDVPFLKALTEYTEERLSCIEPDYTGWIDPRAIRRMSRVIRMGVASAAHALKEGGIEKPDAIITGTALGCLDDTGIFLTKIIENKEQALNPTPFIQSTHNTIGSQVALLLQCFGYNQTYTHRAFSFESALLDGMLMIHEKNQSQVLVGSADEITNISFDILNRFDLFKQGRTSNLKLFESHSERTIPGEGASYFLLSGLKSESAYAVINDMATLYKPAGEKEINSWLSAFLEKNNLLPQDVDVVFLGKNGDSRLDASYHQFAANFQGKTIAAYKHLCGEYETANSFALWVAAKMLKKGKIPATVFQSGDIDVKPKRVLIYNQYLGSHHSLILLESC